VLLATTSRPRAMASGGNLDIRLDLLDSSGAVVASDD
jgi:hypothetical protein